MKYCISNPFSFFIPNNALRGGYSGAAVNSSVGAPRFDLVNAINILTEKRNSVLQKS